MPRRSILSAAERDSLLALPDTQDELIRHYTFSEPDLSLIRQRRGDANRLGVAVQLCLLRFPGQGLLPDTTVPLPMLQWIGRQLRLDTACWPQYAEREETRREHLLELRAYLGMEPFGLAHYRQAVHAATELALQTDKGIVLASSVLDALRHRHIILPTLDVVERVCAEAITRANRRIYDALAEPLSDTHRRRLDDLLKRRDNGKTTWLAWLRQSPAKPNSRHMLEHIERLKAWQGLDLLVTAAIVLWNTVYLERAANALRGHSQTVNDALLQYLSPLGWEHINLTGNYLWRSSAKIGAGKFRSLRPLQPA